MADRLTHFDAEGQAHMVDVSDKAVTARVAVAEGHVTMAASTFATISEGRAKKTPDLIPLCHPLPVTRVAVDLTLDPKLPGVRIAATVKTTGQTGVEMEALTAVSTAALTVYDMVKAIDKAMEIGGIRVTLKDGGASGRYEA